MTSQTDHKSPLLEELRWRGFLDAITADDLDAYLNAIDGNAASHPEGCDLRGTDNATSCEGSSTKLSELPDCATAQTRS
ncbi:MAG TPA: hypothetical protein VH350_18580 [Candidatus Sulfotelmatobacter sp.]|nr:hypothetical protein [Candidatus Sulfotelmatobacter sp.]